MLDQGIGQLVEFLATAEQDALGAVITLLKDALDLVVDLLDVYKRQQLLYRMLRSTAEVSEAATGRQALDMIENEHFDLVLLLSLIHI